VNAVEFFERRLTLMSEERLNELRTITVVPPLGSFQVIKAHIITLGLRRLVQVELDRRQNLREAA
jgi:hypothetical protein